MLVYSPLNLTVSELSVLRGLRPFEGKLLKHTDVVSMGRTSTAREVKATEEQLSPVRMPSSQGAEAFRFSGHQTFPLRITWIPKAVGEIVAGRDPLSDIDEGITQLGLGQEHGGSVAMLDRRVPDRLARRAANGS